MKIIHLLIGVGGGGAESFLLKLIQHKNRFPNERVLVVTLTNINTIGHKYDAVGIERASLGIKGMSSILPAFRKFLKILNENKRSVIHAHMFHAGMFAAMARLFVPSNRLVFTLHNNYVKQPYRRLLLFLTKPLRSADIIFSEGTQKWYLKKSSVTIANGVDTSEFNLERAIPDIFTCLFIGRLVEQKNPLYLIELVKKLKGQFKFRILVAGTGELRDTLANEIKKNDLDDYIILLGFNNNVAELLSSSHCLIMPSLWEGMPISILEAGAAGLPIVSTSVGSIPSILNTENSFICQLDDFHVKLKEVIIDYEVALQKARNLRRQIRTEYDIGVAARKHVELYRQVLQD